MRTHFCHEENDWITFEGECNWCGMTENEPITTDEEFRQLMQRMEKNANPNITDD